MGKEECLEHMKSLGLDVFMADGVVMVRVDHVLTNKEHKALAKKFKDSGYDASWRWTVAKKE